MGPRPRVRSIALGAVVLACLVACGRGGKVDGKYVGRWLIDRDESDRRVRAAELELRADGTYTLTVTCDGQGKLLENQWTSDGPDVLLRFAAENVGDERRINAHGAELRRPGELVLAYRAKVGDAVKVVLRKQR